MTGAPKRATVTIERLANGGAGVARIDGLAVFVPRTAPGDVVEITYRVRRRHADGEVRRVLTPSADRVAPRCPHYTDDDCGACQLQHLDYAVQLSAKRRMVVDAFERIARRTVPVADVVPSPEQWAYRNKLTLTMRRHNNDWVMGLRSWKSPDTVFDLQRCDISSAEVVEAWHALRSARQWLPEGNSMRGSIRVVDGRTHLWLSGGARWDTLQPFLTACPQFNDVRWLDDNERTHVLREDADGGAGAFEQVNSAVAGAIRDHVLSVIRATPGTRVVDAYGGRGDLSVRMVEAGRTPVLIELDRDLAAAAQTAIGGRGEVLCGRVEEILHSVLPADAVVLNPPRTGADHAAMRALEVLPRAPLLIYVSCDPATLARDVSRLPGYRVQSVLPFDMFPQTAHVEVVCVLTPGSDS